MAVSSSASTYTMFTSDLADPYKGTESVQISLDGDYRSAENPTAGPRYPE